MLQFIQYKYVKLHIEVISMKQKMIHFIYLVVGNIFIAFAVSTLLLDNHIVVGGVSGIGLIFNHYYGVSVSLCVGIINVVLFTIGLIFMGKMFAMTTLFSTFFFPLVLEFFEGHSQFHGYLQDPLLASLIAGTLVGIGVGLVLRANASTGGIDILAIVLNKKLGFPVHIVLNCVDFMILLFQFTFNDTTHVIYGIVAVVITSFMLNKTLTMGTSLIQLVVMSDEYQEIKEMILHDQDAGVTLLSTEKGYTQEKTQVILSVIPYRKLPSIKEKINQIDPFAFIIVSHIDEVGGNGFTFEKRV